MRRILPGRIRDTFYLSKLLGLYLTILQQAPIQASLRVISHDARIPEHILELLAQAHLRAEQLKDIAPEDFHIVFSNIMFRYPTVKIWETKGGEVFFEL